MNRLTVDFCLVPCPWVGDWPGKKNPHFSFDDNFFVIIIGLPRLLFYVTKAIIQFLQLFVILLHCGSQCTHILVQVSDIISWYSRLCKDQMLPLYIGETGRNLNMRLTELKRSSNEKWWCQKSHCCTSLS